MKNILKSTFIKNFALTSGGIGFGIIINFLLQPIITRLYLPETIGTFALIVSIVTILNITSSLGYDKAILPSEGKKEAANILAISVIILLCFSVLVFFLCLFGFDYFFENTKYSGIKKFYLLIPLFVFVKGINKLLQFSLIKNGDYTKNSASEVIKTTAPASLKILFAYLFGSNIIYLIISTLIGAFINSIYLLTKSLNYIKSNVDFNYFELKYTFKKYINYLKYFNWNNLLNAFAQQIIFFLLVTFYTTKEIGYYSLAYGVVLLPLGFISDALFKVFLPHLSNKIKNRQIIGSDFKKVMLYLIFIGLIGFSVLFFIAPSLFEFVFGDEWRQSGVYAKCLIPWIFMLFINKPANSVIQIFQKFKFLTIYNITLLFGRIIVVLIGYYFYKSVIISLVLFSFVGFFWNLVFIIYSYNLVLRYDSNI